MKIYKKIFISVAAIITVNMAVAQNVGIGTTFPTDKMHVHGGNEISSVTRYSNDATGVGSDAGMRVGIQYQAGIHNNQYGYIAVQGAMPFYIWQANNPRFQMDGSGYFGIRTKPISPFSLAINGPSIIFPGNGQPAQLAMADTIFNTQLPIGLSMEKRNRLNSKHFLSLSIDQSKALALLEANFFNGGFNNKTAQIRLDSNGRIGMGENISANTILSDLHLFGNQRLEGTAPGRLMLHSPTDDYFNGSKINFFYTPAQKLTNNPSDPSMGYFVGLNDAVSNVDEARAFAIGKSTFPIFGNGEIPGFVHNYYNQVGIRRYPESAANNDIKIDMMGNTRLTASKLTINRPFSETTASNSIELRNDGIYKYGFGFDVSSDRFFLYEGKSNSNALLIDNNRIGLAGRAPTTNALELNGNASKSTAGSWLGNSDARLKKNIHPINNALNILLQLKGVNYEWNDNKTGYERPAGMQLGFTAQNVKEVFPGMVSTDAQGYLQTAYGSFDPLIVEAIRELKNENELLKKELEAIKQLLQQKN